MDSDIAARPSIKRLPKKRGMPESYQAALMGIVSLAILLFVWEMVARANLVSKILFAGPSDIWAAFIKILANGQLLSNVQISMTELALGFGLAMVTAIPVGLAIGVFRRTEIVLSPYLMALYSTPRVALFPLIVGFIGFGLGSQVLLIFLAAFFPIVINTWAGVKTVDPVLIKLGKFLCASRMQMFTKIIVPYCVPYIITGLRLGIGQALMAIYVAEMLGANAGLGFMIVRAGTEFRTGELFAGIIVFGILGIAFTQIMRYIEQRVAPWRQETSV